MNELKNAADLETQKQSCCQHVPTEGYQTVLLFGGPGTGKGTQGKLLSCIPGFFHFASGNVFRAVDSSSELGRIFRDFSTRGELVPDDVTMKMCLQALQAHTILGDYRPRRDLLILDGLPRTLNQARLLEGQMNIKVVKVIHMVGPDPEVMVQRIRGRALKEKRLDDANERTIRHRWEVYERETQPILEFYPAQIVSQVDALGTPVKVLRDVLNEVIPVQLQEQEVC